MHGSNLSTDVGSWRSSKGIVFSEMRRKMIEPLNGYKQGNGKIWFTFLNSIEMAVLWAVEDLTRTGEINAGTAAVPQVREDADESAIKIVEG